MNYKFPRYLDPKYNKIAPWQNVKQLVNGTQEQMRKGVRIDFRGFHPIAD